MPRHREIDFGLAPAAPRQRQLRLGVERDEYIAQRWGS